MYLVGGVCISDVGFFGVVLLVGGGVCISDVGVSGVVLLVD